MGDAGTVNVPPATSTIGDPGRLLTSADARTVAELRSEGWARGEHALDGGRADGVFLDGRPTALAGRTR